MEYPPLEKYVGIGTSLSCQLRSLDKLELIGADCETVSVRGGSALAK